MKIKESKMKMVLFLIVFILFFSICVFLYQQSRTIFPDATEYIALNYKNSNSSLEQESNLIRLAEIESVQNDIDIAILNAQIRETDIVQSVNTSLLSDNVNIIYTDEFYPAIHAIRIIKGNFFSSSAVNCNVVVISEDLANLLFKSVDVIGNKIILSGETKTIVGIYSINKTIVSEFASNGLDTVFVPINLLKDTDSVETLYIQSVNQIENKEIIQKCNVLLNGKLSSYQSTNLHSTKMVLQQWFFILIFVVVIVISLQLCVVVYKMFSSVIVFLRKNSNTKILSKKIVPYILICFGCISVVILFFTFCSFSLYIPEGFLPDKGQAFDVMYYYQYILNHVQEVRALNRWYYYQELEIILSTLIPVITIYTVIIFLQVFFYCIKFINIKFLKHRSNINEK